MRQTPLLTTVVFLSSLSAPAFSEAASTPIAMGPGAISAVNEYLVLRNGKKIGTHNIHFERSGDQLTVKAKTRMRVKFLFLTAYKYDYVSTEQWQNGRLISVSTNVNDNGKKTTAEAELDTGGYVTRINGETGFAEGPLFTTNHWNIGAMQQSGLFNTITAKVNEISVDEYPPEQRYKVRGELNIDSFYDTNGHWLGMQFEHTDGSTIEFKCQSCTNTPDHFS